MCLSPRGLLLPVTVAVAPLTPSGAAAAALELSTQQVVQDLGAAEVTKASAAELEQRAYEEGEKLEVAMEDARACAVQPKMAVCSRLTAAELAAVCGRLWTNM